MALQKETIVAKALELLNRDGLEGVTLRRVAAELQVKAASLYWHMQSKRDLLDEMAEEMLSRHFTSYEPPSPTTPWQSWLMDIVHTLRRALLSYRDGGLVVAGANPHRAKTFAKLGAYIVSTLSQVYGFDLAGAGTLCSTVILYTWASVIEEQTAPPLEEILQKGLAIEQYLPASVEQSLTDMPRPEDTTVFFNQGLKLIIVGAEKTERARPN